MTSKSPEKAQGFSVMLSASLPKELEKTRRAQELFDLMVLLIGGILSSSYTLVFGGHPTVTPLVHRIASSAASSKEPQIRLFQLARFRKKAPEEINDRRVFGEVTWVGAERGDDASLGSDLGRMRDSMVIASQAAIFVGGQTEGFSGSVPGIRDEYRRFMKRRRRGPIYLLGILGGETLNIIDELKERGKREPNSLSEAELKILHHSDNVDLVSSLVLADIHRAVNQRES